MHSRWITSRLNGSAAWSNGAIGPSSRSRPRSPSIIGQRQSRLIDPHLGNAAYGERTRLAPEPHPRCSDRKIRKRPTSRESWQASMFRDVSLCCRIIAPWRQNRELGASPACDTSTAMRHVRSPPRQVAGDSSQVVSISSACRLVSLDERDLHALGRQSEA